MFKVLAHGQPITGHPLLAQLAQVVYIDKARVTILFFILINGDLMLGHVFVECTGVGGDGGAADLAGPGALIEPLHLLGRGRQAVVHF